MSRLLWDAAGTRLYETGVDRGVLYIPDNSGDYVIGYAWNGLTAVTESPSGAEATALFADNIKYLNIRSAEDFGCTIEAYTYPDEFGQCDGTASPQVGINVGQQARKTFGLSYRTRLGNDIDNADFGYKLHLVYGCSAAPSERAFATINDSPEAITFSWEVSTTPVPITGLKPTAIITIDSTKVSASALSDLEDLLYGTAGTDPSMPLPDALVAIFAGSLTVATPTMPSYNSSTDTITIPSITGVVYKIDGEVVTGSVVITADTIVTASPAAGYKFPPVTDNDWLIVHT